MKYELATHITQRMSVEEPQLPMTAWRKWLVNPFSSMNIVGLFELSVARLLRLMLILVWLCSWSLKGKGYGFNGSGCGFERKGCKLKLLASPDQCVSVDQLQLLLKTWKFMLMCLGFSVFTSFSSYDYWELLWQIQASWWVFWCWLVSQGQYW